MIYLASPWSHQNPEVRKQRHADVLQATVALLRAGHLVYSPIVYSVPLHEAGLDGSWETWEKFDRAIIQRCSFLWVLCLDGWLESKGVSAEILIASELNIPIRCLSLEQALNGGTY